MNLYKRLTASLLAAAAAVTFTLADIPGLPVSVISASASSVSYKGVEYLNDDESIIAEIAKHSMKRESRFTINMYSDTADLDSYKLADYFDKSITHTGVPDEGDYISYQYNNIDFEVTGVRNGSDYYINLTYIVNYLTTEQQEKAVDEKVESVLASLDLEGKSDYEKIEAIHDWLRDNCEYDYDNLNNKEYTLKFTAYAALINGTAVCQGYANALYRLLLEAGIDCRIVTGQLQGGEHAWNIIRLGDRYYFVDVTNDRGHNRFLKGLDDLSSLKMVINDQFTTIGFLSEYPISRTAYEKPADPTDPDDPDDPVEPAEVRFDVTAADGSSFDSIIIVDETTGAVIMADELTLSLENAEYTFKIYKEGYVPVTVNITVNGEDITTDKLVLRRYGDINGDGKVNTQDAMKAVALAKKAAVVSGYDFAAADVNADGVLNSKDALAVINAAKNKKNVKDPNF